MMHMSTRGPYAYFAFRKMPGAGASEINGSMALQPFLKIAALWQKTEDSSQIVPILVFPLLLIVVLVLFLIVVPMV